MQIIVIDAVDDVRQRQLSLGALARIEQDDLIVPAQHVAVVVAIPRRHLARRTQDHQLSGSHC